MQHTIGVFGMTGSITPVAIRQWKVLGYRGVKLAAKWSMLQPTETDLSFSAFYDWLTLLINDELDVNIQVWVGNHAPIGGTETVQGKPVKQPDWLARKGVIPFTLQAISSPALILTTTKKPTRKHSILFTEPLPTS